MHAKAESGEAGKGKSAIMRRMPIRYNKNADIAKKIQQKELETEKKDNKENDKKRIESMSTN